MADGRETLCFECGQVVGSPPLLNRLPDGGNCPRCAERVLEALPPALPGARHAGPVEEDSDYEFDLPGADFRPEDPPEPA